ncbi:MAG: hypothetical protein JW779_02450 [Candidatus Thorarchaeota archaeon]|nr:hypothetical protein [Candidatus Thorarchaeota archaeon]
MTFDQQSVKMKLDKILTSIELLKTGAAIEEEDFLKNRISNLLLNEVFRLPHNLSLILPHIL